jgi:hypothetical protein
VETAAQPILRKAGVVLVVVGLIDIAVMIYCIINRISYSSSFNVFAVIAGALLIRGGLRTAGVVRCFATFMLAALASLLVAWPLLQPLDLTLTEVRLNPVSALGGGALYLAILAFLFWLQRELGRPPILAARVAAGRRQRDMRIPAALGFLVVFLAVLLSGLFRDDAAEKAKSIAQQQLGAEYQYHVSSLYISESARERTVEAVVTAWKDREIKDVPVEWKERRLSR